MRQFLSCFLFLSLFATILPAQTSVTTTYGPISGITEEGIFAFDPRPASEWIYHPKAFSEKAQVQHAVFRKTFQLDSADIERAGLQLQGDTHLKVYVNGKLAGEQFARRNFSAPVRRLSVL